MYYPDTPIEEKKDDLLHYSVYVDVITKYLLKYSHSDSITIGLFGCWGSGKTSIIKMVKNEIDRSKVSDRPHQIVIEFEPWLYSDESQIISQFFKVLSDKLTSQRGKKLKEIGNAMTEFSDLFELTRGIPFVGEYLSVIPKDAFKSVGNKLVNKNMDLVEQRNKIVKLLEKQTKKMRLHQ